MDIVWAALGWKKRKSHTLVHAAGVGINYQKELILHYGEGIDSGKDIYFNGKCRTDFGDIRFFSPDGVELDYFIPPSTLNIGTSASCFVEIKDDLSSIDRDIWIYYENPNAISKSNADATFVSIIPNVALAMPLDEEDTEQAGATVIVNSNFATFWNIKGSFSAGGTIGDPVLSEENGALKIEVGSGSNQKWFVQHTYSPAADLSYGSRFILNWNCTNSGKQFVVFFKTTNNDKYSIIFTDNFVGNRVVLTKSSASVAGTPNWNSIVFITIESWSENVNGTFYAGRYVLDVGVPAIDYSGNGNNGTATGTTITDSTLYVDKFQRVFNGIADKITLPNLPESQTYEVAFKFKTTQAAEGRMFSVSRSLGGTKFVVWVTTAGTIALNWFTDDDTTQNSLTTTASYNDDAWHTLKAVINDDGKFSLKVDDETKTKTSTLTALTYDGVDYVGCAASGEHCFFAGAIADLVFGTTVFMDDTQFAAFADYYPDPSLISGSVCIRKWANVVDGVYGVEEDYYKSTWLFDSNNNKYITIDGGKSLTLNPNYITELTWLFPE